MKKLLYTLPLTLMTAVAGCVDEGPQMPGGPAPLVIEGWIEEGLPPVVMVTRAVDLTTDTASFDGFVEKWARVTVYDGDTPYLLGGRINNDYVPSFIYTTARLHGKTGHTYRLVVETDIDTVEAVTTMLPAPTITGLEKVRTSETDSLYSLQAFVDGISSEGYYKFFSTTRGVESRYYGTFLGTFSGRAYNPAEGWNITRGIHSVYDDSLEFSHFFKPGELVTVSVSAIERDLYDFWSVYDSNISLSQNLLFTFAGNCPSNITGGLGYWAAYSTGRMTVRIP